MDFFSHTFNVFDGTSVTQQTGFFLLLIISCAIFFIIGFLWAKLKDSKEFKKHRSDAINRSRAVIGGQVAEQLAPFFPDFPCNPGDARFVGKPIDFIAFNGISEGKEVSEILLIEVKTGSSGLSTREKEIRKAVEEGRVRYVEYRI